MMVVTSSKLSILIASVQSIVGINFSYKFLATGSWTLSVASTWTLNIFPNSPLFSAHLTHPILVGNRDTSIIRIHQTCQLIARYERSGGCAFPLPHWAVQGRRTPLHIYRNSIGCNKPYCSSSPR